MTLSLPDKWIWDQWYAFDGALHHAYFLQADKALRDPELRHFNVTQAHATSRDLKNWTHLGTCFKPSASPAWDDFTTWTGSVVKGDDGLWHLFYTGTSRADQGLKQRIGHAVSDDMHSWKRVGSGLALDISGPDYEEFTPGHWHDRAMRDPWVMRDPSGAGWLMFFTARVPHIQEPNAGGSIGLATSPDLNHWTIQPPVYRGGTFGQMEVPQVFERNGRWYCLFCTSAHQYSAAMRAAYSGAPVTGTHYLIGESPRGPWRVAPGAFLDGSLPCKRYAARIVEHDGALCIIGFLHDAPDGSFIGMVSDPDPVEVGADGLLHVIPAN